MELTTTFTGGLRQCVTVVSTATHPTSHVSSKATRTLNLLQCNMYCCNTPAKNKAFRALVLPVLDYASTVWNPHTQKNIFALVTIQNRGRDMFIPRQFGMYNNT